MQCLDLHIVQIIVVFTLLLFNKVNVNFWHGLHRTEKSKISIIILFTLNKILWGTVTWKYHRSLLLLYQQQSLVGEGHSGVVGGHVARRCWHHLVLLGVRRGRRLGAAARQSRQEGALLGTPRTAGVVVQSKLWIISTAEVQDCRSSTVQHTCTSSGNNHKLCW